MDPVGLFAILKVFRCFLCCAHGLDGISELPFLTFAPFDKCGEMRREREVRNLDFRKSAKYRNQFLLASKRTSTRNLAISEMEGHA